MRHPVPQRGFSLLELLMVVTIMGILAALALPTLTPGAHEELQAAAQLVCGDLAYGRSLAVANNSRYRFRFQSAYNRYILEHSGANAALNTLPEAPFRSPSDLPSQQTVDLADLPHLAGHNVRVAGVTSSNGTRLTPAEVEFGPLGETTRTAETIVWLAGGTGGQTRYLPIHVNPVSGLATIGQYASSGPAPQHATNVSTAELEAEAVGP